MSPTVDRRVDELVYQVGKMTNYKGINIRDMVKDEAGFKSVRDMSNAAAAMSPEVCLLLLRNLPGIVL